MDHCFKFVPNSEVVKIRGVPGGVRYGLVSALQIKISPVESVSALKTNMGIIKLALLHMQNP